MKIGIVTFHRAVNYGAVLQAFALCRTLRDMGHECDIIDYRSRFIEEYYDSASLLKPKNWKRLVSYIISNGNLNPNKDRYTTFLQNNRMLSLEKYYTHDDLITINDKYDLFIAGSDQVWNYATAGFDKAYFLDFVVNNVKKASYAASFGFSELPKEYNNKYIELLSSFAHISVREESGKRIIESLLPGADVTVDLDPTLLLTSNDWTTVSNSYGEGNKGYILVYMIGENKEILNIAKQFASENNVEVKYISDRWMTRKGVTNLRKVNPAEWIYLFKNSDYIITNSFHGTVFSILFRKKFVVLGNADSKKRASRLVNILSELNLTNRMTYDYKEALYELPLDIDYDSVEGLLAVRRNDSLETLKSLVREKGE